MKFERKDYGRFFVEKAEDIDRVKKIMMQVDSEEFTWYYPSGNCLGSKGELIADFNESQWFSVYTQKFDNMDMTEVLKRCWDDGIKCFVVIGTINNHDRD